jgi:hypothetical protein
MVFLQQAFIVDLLPAIVVQKSAVQRINFARRCGHRPRGGSARSNADLMCRFRLL